MATKISQESLNSAAQEITTSKISSSRSRTGQDEKQQRWESVRAKACQGLLSEPDSLIYFIWLASNTLAADLRVWHGLLCEVIVLAESAPHYNELTRANPVDIHINRNALIQEVRKSRTGGTSPKIKDLSSKVANYLKPLSSEITRKKKVERGPKSATNMRSLIAEAVIQLRSLQVRASILQRGNSRISATLSAGAVDQVLHSMEATLRREDLTSEQMTLQIASGVGAINAFSRPVSMEYLVHTGKGSPFSLTPMISGTTLTLERNGEAVSLSQLFITAGCIAHFVSSDTDVEITSVTDSQAILATEVSLSGSLIIRTKVQSEYSSFRSTVLRRLSLGVMARVVTLYKQRPMRRISRPEAARVAAIVAPVVAMLAPLTSEAERSMKLLSIEIPSSGTILDDIRNFSPKFSNKSKGVGDQILDMMKANSFDLVEARLLKGDLGGLSIEDASKASISSATAEAASQYMKIIDIGASF